MNALNRTEGHRNRQLLLLPPAEPDGDTPRARPGARLAARGTGGRGGTRAGMLVHARIRVEPAAPAVCFSRFSSADCQLGWVCAQSARWQRAAAHVLRPERTERPAAQHFRRDRVPHKPWLGQLEIRVGGHHLRCRRQVARDARYVLVHVNGDAAAAELDPAGRKSAEQRARTRHQRTLGLCGCAPAALAHEPLRRVVHCALPVHGAAQQRRRRRPVQAVRRGG